MADPPQTPPGHWVQCPECQRFFENEQGRGSHRLHSHGIRATGETWLPARPTPPPQPPVPAPSPPEPAPPTPPSMALTPAQSAVDWSDGKNAPAGLSAIAQTLAATPPPPTMTQFGRGVVVFIVFALSGLALYLVVQQLKGAKQPERPFVIDAARIQPGAPVLMTGDPYWDSILGYRGLRI